MSYSIVFHNLKYKTISYIKCFTSIKYHSISFNFACIMSTQTCNVMLHCLHKHVMLHVIAIYTLTSG